MFDEKEVLRQEKDRLKKEMLLKLRETKANLLKMTDNQLDTTTKRTIAENEQMSSELAWQSKETEKRPNMRSASMWKKCSTSISFPSFGSRNSSIMRVVTATNMGRCLLMFAGAKNLARQPRSCLCTSPFEVTRPSPNTTENFSV
mgnify:CR=1 FL=1